MRIGTKSVLFGFHNPLIHGVAVLLAWLILYRNWPAAYELAAIFTHDLGYLGCPNMDGPEGEKHPARAAAWWRRWGGRFGHRVAAEILGHSRFYAEAHGLELSRLFYADKLGGAIYPLSLAMLLLSWTGEIHEYRQASRDGRYENGAGETAWQWLVEMRIQTARLGLEGREASQ